jgi:hypothetical protein
MAFDYARWRREFPQEDIPSFPCPCCKRGVAVIDERTLKIEEPTYVRGSRSADGWEPSWDISRFIFFMRCAVATCGEIIAVSGTVTTDMYMDDEFGWAGHNVLHPHSVMPAPYIISLPDDMPSQVTNPLIEAFELFWPDLGSSANRLRVSVERLLDEFNIPHQSLNAKGKTTRLALGQRIDAFKAHDPDHAQTLDALREVGNVGSHEGAVQWQVLLDAFQLYEAALAELIGKRTAIPTALRKKIIDGKGKYSS